ncbi:hypothetical protein CARUB_v10016415mg [Capsella rubella]|uniref:F-box domain-containing protein n=1 Tax=Capsella rubella TaxID=81985 RepID=R0I994_9BRAS|nr:hypothetical protein CARUB_v10016415mg [Capsella rubella]
MMSDLRKDLAEEVFARLPVTSRSACKKGNTLSKERSFTKKQLGQDRSATKKKKKKKEELPSMLDLPRDMAEEVLARLPMTSLRGFRAACKTWNTLSKDGSFTRKHLAQAKAAAVREFTVVMVIDFKVYLTNLSLHKGVDRPINHQGKLTSLDDPNQVEISGVYHCDGLVLCITKGFTRLVVWNPYWGQTLWVKPRRLHQRPHMYRYAIGYQNSKSCRSYKILRSVEFESVAKYEIYELNSNSWRVLDVTCDWYLQYYARGVSLKGNTYWFGVHKERFGPRLGLPFRSFEEDTVSLSSVREEQLAVLFQRWDNLHMEIWVTTKIEPHVVSWSKLFLAVDMEPLTGLQFAVTKGSFFIDQEKKLVVVFDNDKDRDKGKVRNPRNTAYIIGEDGYFRQVDLGESSERSNCPLGCSYVPSSVLLKPGGKRKKKNPIIY